MADDIIDLTRYLRREPEGQLPRGAMSLWGADGERSRFALPLWRIIYLARAERGVIVSRERDSGEAPAPYVALDLGREPARTEVEQELPAFDGEHDASLVEQGADGLVIYLGDRDGRAWTLVVDGGDGLSEPLSSRAREDILFLAGECAGLLFFRELADDPE